MNRSIIFALAVGLVTACGTAAAGADANEFLFDTSRTYIPASGYQRISSAAFDGTSYLVAWGDWRDANYEVVVTRVSPDGAVLDPGGIPVSSGPGARQEPVVAFNGTNYFIAWIDERNGGDEIDVYGARVTPAGTVLDPDGIAICTAAGWQYWMDIAVLGDQFLVVWTDERNGGELDVYGTRVTAAGQVLDPDGIAICRDSLEQDGPVVTACGSNWLVAWGDCRGGEDSSWTMGARVSPAGQVLDPNGLRISHGLNVGWPAIASDGANVLVAYPGDNDTLYGALVAPAGQVQNGLILAASDFIDDPDAEFDGTNYLVSWNYADYRVYGVRVTPAGISLDPDGFIIESGDRDVANPAVAGGTGGWLVTWDDERVNGIRSDIYCCRVSGAGALLDPDGFAASVAAHDQHRPAAAFDGLRYMAVWEDGRLGGDTLALFGGRIWQSGLMLDPRGFLVSRTAGSSQGYAYPDIECDGSNFLVAWCNYPNGPGLPDIYGIRISPEGQVLDPGGIPISTGTGTNDETYPALAFDGANYLVVWTDRRDNTYHTYGARVTPAGTVLDTAGIQFSAGQYGELDPAIAFGAGNYLVAWIQNGRNSVQDIYGTRVAPDGTVLDPGGIAISTANESQLEPAVGFDGTNYVVAWTDRRSNRLQPDVYGARVTPDGAVLDPGGIAVGTDSGTQQNPAVMGTGSGSVIAWSDGRGGIADLYAAWLNTAGTITDTQAVATQEGGEVRPALARGNGDEFLFAWEGWAGETRGKNFRTVRTWGRIWPAPGVAGKRAPGVPRTALAARPNPFTGSTVLRLPAGAVRGAAVRIFDTDGRLVRELEAGQDRLAWDGCDQIGRRLPGGVYFVRADGPGALPVVIAR